MTLCMDKTTLMEMTWWWVNDHTILISFVNYPFTPSISKLICYSTVSSLKKYHLFTQTQPLFLL